MAKGYDNVPANMQLLLDLQFREGVGTVVHDWAKPHHEPVTLVNAPTWANLGNGLPYLDLVPAGPDHLIILAAGSADLDFTSGAFSGAAWFNPHVVGERMVFNKGGSTEGWAFYITTATGQMQLLTLQAAASQYTNGAALTLSTWQLVGFTRSGANVRIYTNGRDVTYTVGTHVDPDTADTFNFYIGCNNLAVGGWMDGYLWRPRVWNRALTAAEMLYLFETERGLFGV